MSIRARVHHPRTSGGAARGSSPATARRSARTPVAMLVAAALAVTTLAGLTLIGGGAANAASAPAPVASTTKPAPKTTVTITGKLTPAAKRPVVLQKKSGHTWVRLASSTTTRTGAYRFKITVPATAGAFTVRVTAKAGRFKVGHKRKHLSARTSKSRTLTVTPVKPKPPTPPKPPAPPTSPAPTSAERAALLDLYNATDGPAWAHSTGWNTTANACTWYGVTCNTAGNVTGLNLNNNQLSGALPDSLDTLASITTLNLDNNGCLTASSTLTAWLNALDPKWSNGCTTSTPPASPAPTSAERAALLDLYNATNGPAWAHSTGWNTTANACTWYGVTCNSAGNVTGLSLSGNQLSGSIPTSLGNLVNLTSLDLSWNQLPGAIPTALGSLTGLTALNLSNSQFTGAIPDALSTLVHLTYLDLSGNQLTGAVPTSLGALAGLTYLNLNNNQLSGTIPDVLSTLTGLTTLNLSGNQLSGAIPKAV